MFLYSMRPYVIVVGCVGVPGVSGNPGTRTQPGPPEDSHKYGPKHVEASFKSVLSVNVN